MKLPKIEAQEVIGALKATGSRDKDVLYRTKTELIKVHVIFKSQASSMMVAGIVCTVTVCLAPIGIPLIIIASLRKKDAVSNIQIADAAYDQYIAGL